MALIIEDGSGVVGANSYVDAAYASSYASSRGENLPTDPAEVEKLLIQAMDYIEAFRNQFQGSKTDPTQELQWPRINVVIDDQDFPSDAIPKELRLAQSQLAIDSYAIGGLTPTTDSYAIAKEKIDVIEVEYATGGRLSGSSPPAQPTFPKADAFLEPLLEETGLALAVIRV